MDACDLSARDARALIGSLELSPVELLDSCIARIERVNPVLNAVTATSFERARHEARLVEQQAVSGTALPPLAGLPVLVKDTTDTAGLRTTYGSPLFADHVPELDSPSVQRIRGAGGVVIGKTNVPEWAAGAVTTNPVWGATGNPFAPDLTCGGSSGGSAAALAAGMAPLATGSDLGGSLRNPAAFCSVVGLRPTPGMVPDGRQRPWFPLSVEGPMARNVSDTALLLSAMAASSVSDPLSTGENPGELAQLADMDLSSLRVATTEDLGFAAVEEGIRTTFRARTSQLGQAWGPAEKVSLDLGDAPEVFGALRGLSFVANHLDRMEQSPDQIGPFVTENVNVGLELTSRDIANAEKRQGEIYRQFVKLFGEVDVLVAPATTVSPFPKDADYCRVVEGKPMPNYYEWLSITYGLTLVGCPVIAIPCGVDHNGLPFGIQVVGAPRTERRLLSIARALEAYMGRTSELRQAVPDLNALVGERTR